MRSFSVRVICDRYGVSEGTVLGWIRCGDLRAVNVGRNPGAKKPRWRITEESLAAFEQMRTPVQAQPKTRRRRQAADVVEFYPVRG